MNKISPRLKSLIPVLVIVLVLVIIAVYFSLGGSGKTGVVATYRCEEGFMLKAELDDKKGLITLEGGTEYELSRIKDANGARYKSSDGLVEFWDQGGEAVFKEDGKTRFTSCLVQSGFDASNPLSNLDSWPTYQSEATTDGFSVSFDYPNQADLKEVDNGVMVTYKTSESSNFSVSEGFTFNSLILDAASALEVVTDSEVDEIRFSGRTAQSFVTGESDDLSQNLLVKLDDETYGLISYKIIGQTNRNMKAEIITAILDSVSFSEVLEGGSVDESPSDVGATSEVTLAFLAPATTTPERGCDNVVLTSRAVVPTTKPLTKALELLFTTPSTETGTNYVLNTADTLQFDRASVVNGEARIYLSGALTGINGVCDEPRVQSQLEETALQFETVNSVQLFLNGQAIDKLSDSEGLQG